MPYAEAFHNTYLFPKYSKGNPFGVPGRLRKGHIFALRQPATTDSPGSGDSRVGDKQEDQADEGNAPADSVVANLGRWEGFPSALRLSVVPFYDLWRFAGTYYENRPELVQEGIWFPQDASGDWVYLDGTRVPDEEALPNAAAVYGSMLAEIPEWKVFSDGNDLDYIYHTIDGIGFIESATQHNSGGESHMYTVPEHSVPTASTSDAVTTNSGRGKTARPQVDWTRYKTFQFNPPEWEFSYAMMMSTPSESGQQGGTSSNTAPGFVKTSVKLSFDRTMEVYAATNGTNPAVDPVFAEVGVQQDVFEVFKIMMDPTDYNSLLQGYEEDEPQSSGLIGSIESFFRNPKSMKEMNEVMFDIAGGGSKIAFSPIAIVFNDYFTIQGWVVGLTVAYAAFNNNLVPTMAAVDLDIEVLNVAQASASTILNPSASNPVPLTSSSLSASVPSASGGTKGTQRVPTRSQLLTRPVTVRGGSVRYSAS